MGAGGIIEMVGGEERGVVVEVFGGEGVGCIRGCVLACGVGGGGGTLGPVMC